MISEIEETFTVPGVLTWMGDLSHEKNIAKHAARRSLVRSYNFSSSDQHMTVPIAIEYNPQIEL